MTGWTDPDLHLGRDALEALQLKRLRWSVRHAWDNVAHYRAKCQKAQVHPDDLKTREDLAKFPFVEKDDLRQTYPYGLFATPRDSIRRPTFRRSRKTSSAMPSLPNGRIWLGLRIRARTVDSELDGAVGPQIEMQKAG